MMIVVKYKKKKITLLRSESESNKRKVVIRFPFDQDDEVNVDPRNSSSLSLSCTPQHYEVSCTAFLNLSIWLHLNCAYFLFDGLPDSLDFGLKSVCVSHYSYLFIYCQREVLFRIY